MACPLDRDGHGALLPGRAVGLATIGDLAALVEGTAEALDILVVDDVADGVDGLLAAAPAATEPTAAATAAFAAVPAALTAIATGTVATGTVATVTTRAAGTIPAAGSVTTAGTIPAALRALTPIGAITTGGTLGTGGEPGAGTLLATGAGLLACLRRISHWSVYSLATAWSGLWVGRRRRPAG